MSTLAKDRLWEYLRRPLEEDPLVVTPLLDLEEQIGAASIDVRLGHEFIILRRTSIDRVDPTEPKRWRTNIHRTQERVRISRHREFIIHPQQLVLGSTLEYVSVPRGLFASVEGRSSWGRLGLIIATASSISPGYKGTITLELVNAGEVPLALYPGICIAQLIFHETVGEGTYEGRYSYPTGPQFSRLHRDKNIVFWGSQELTRETPDEGDD